MDFSFSEEQQEFRLTVQQFVRRHSPVAAARGLHDRQQSFDGDTWRRMGTELGLHGLHIAEDRGGQGFNFLELALVAGEMGGELVCSPYFASSVVAASLLDRLPRSEAVDRLLASVASGVCVAALAPDSGGGDLRFTADDASRGRLDGVAPVVPFGSVADVLLALAVNPEGVPVLVSVPKSEVATDAVELLDLCDRAARCAFLGATATVLASGEQVSPAVAHTNDLAATYLSCEMVGGADACLREAVAYALQRQQFGRLIGSFQAIKHLCANMYAEIELARSAAHYAAWCTSTDDPATPRHASLAKALASETYLFVADAALHVHGGIGFTWEHDSHLHLRRARSRSLQFGDVRSHRERFLLSSGFGRTS